MISAIKGQIPKPGFSTLIVILLIHPVPSETP